MADATTTEPAIRFRDLEQRSEHACWRLHVVASSDPARVGSIHRLETGMTLLGRNPTGPGAVLAFADHTMSRTHVGLIVRGAENRVEVVDRGSRNGTWVAAHRVERAFVGDGAVLRVGALVAVLEADGGAAIAHDAPTREVPGRTEVARKVRAATAAAAHDALGVLVSGETGTGKEFVAAELHRRSRPDGPLVRLNIVAIPETLFESELFGHVKGAFSGAAEGRPGRVREANGGTLVLDEIGELPLVQQPKLLRVLEEAAVRPVGGRADVPVDVRFVASTNADLDAMVQQGSFRADLLARLRGHRVALLPLRQRRADLLDLADEIEPHTEGRRWAEALEPDAVEALLLYDWPENLRELRAALVRLRGGAAGRMATAQDLPAQIVEAVRRRLREANAEPEHHELASAREPRQTRPSRQALLELIERHDGNVGAIARIMDTHRKQVYRWLDYAGIDRSMLDQARDDARS
ncbi:MAG: sigma 54-interacting transcriptional regulator [Deltaproteobacteria bacterium]|nr:sigma 54-interacting transcriptional regulator [Deltaproteobacteria bacterium]